MVLTLANGIWSEWSPLMNCSNTTAACGSNSTWYRTRTCTNPKPYLGGEYCPGSDTQAISQGGYKCFYL